MLHPSETLAPNASVYSEEIVDVSVYTGINLSTAPKSRLYAQNEDYIAADSLGAVLSNATNPNIALQWSQHFSPQALHHMGAAQVLNDDVIENCPFHIQKAHKPVNANSDANQQDVPNPNYTDLYAVVQNAQKVDFT